MAATRIDERRQARWNLRFAQADPGSDIDEEGLVQPQANETNQTGVGESNQLFGAVDVSL